MTAGFFIATPSPAGPAAIATGVPGAAHGITGTGAATGFEALLAAFFGNQGAGTATAQAALLSGGPGLTKTATAGLGANDNTDNAGKTDTSKDDETKVADGQTVAAPTISAEVQGLAALMATPVTVPVIQASTAAPAKTDGAAAPTAGAAFASQKLLSPATAKAQAAADQAASALAADADAADVAKDAAALADAKTGLAKPAPPNAAAGATTNIATPAPSTTAPAEAGTTPYTPPSPAKTEVAPPSPPVVVDAPAPAATAADQAAVAAAATQAAIPAPVATKSKDLPASHAADRLDTTHRTTSDPPAIDGVAPVTQHPITAVTPVAAKTGEQIGEGDKPLAEDAKIAKVDDSAGATQPAAVAAADHSAQATATTAARATPETVASLAAQILRKADGRTSRFDVELHPADLGRVDVRLEIGATGRMTAAMSFENPQAAAELRGRAHELQAALERAGFDVSGGLTFDVAGDQGQGNQNLASQQQQQQQDSGGASRGRAFQAALQSAGDTTAAAHSAAVYGQSRITSGVDIRI